MKKIFTYLLILSCFSTALFSQSLPRIPDGEVIRYKTLIGRKGEDVEYSNQRISTISEGNNEYYLVKFRSGDRISETKINALTFIPLSLDTTIYGERSDIQQTTTLQREPLLNDNEIALLDMNDLAHVLRAYPFENPVKLNILFMGQGSEEMSSMSFHIEYIEEDTVTLNNRDIKTWKLEMKADFEGAMALFSGMMPKTYLWFSQDPSRHLVKMTSSRGPGADNAVTQEIISYSP